MDVSPAPVDAEPVIASPDEAPLVQILRAALELAGTGSVTRLVDGDGRTIELPSCVRGALIRVVRELSDGNAVAVVPVHAELTTQEAADLLNVSRPYVIGMLDAEKLPCTRTIGGHRRLRLTDVLAYKRQRDHDRRAALDDMSEEAERLGLRY